MTPKAIKQALARRARPDQNGGNPALILAIILGCYLMVVLDVSVVITALPSIHTDLDFSDTGLSWVQNAYTLTFGGLLLVGARALQGVGAAIAAPSTLALLTVSFPAGSERTRALAYYSAVAGAGASVGLVLGGMLTSWVSWRWGLFINVPIGLALAWLAPRHLPETARHTGRFDLPGAATSTAGMVALVYGLVRAAEEGWGDAVALGSFALAAALLAAFVVNERRAAQPITPLRLFSSRERVGAYLARMLVVGAMFGMFFFLTQFLQGAEGYSALTAGCAFLPVSLSVFAMVRVVPRLVPRFGELRVLVGGLTLALIGMAWLSQISVGADYATQVALPMVLIGIGMGTAFTPLTSAGIAGVADGDAGAASGVVNAAHQLGGTLGIGVLITVFAAASQGNPAHALAEGVPTALTASTILVALALTVVLAVMRPRMATAPLPQAEAA